MTAIDCTGPHKRKILAMPESEGEAKMLLLRRYVDLRLLIQALPTTRESALALTKIDEAVMWTDRHFEERHEKNR